ncbi:reverse transcriptase domain-containing protein [Tanacetum coccineum]
MEEAEGHIVKKFFGLGEQVLQATDKNNEGTSREKEKLQDELILIPRAWKLHIGRESSKEGYGVGMVLVDPEGKEYSHAIHLNFHASEDNMDYEALLAGLVVSTEIQMKDLHVFISSRLLVDQVKGNRVLKTEGAKRYREEVMDSTTPFHKFQITYLPKALNPKGVALTGVASI